MDIRTQARQLERTLRCFSIVAGFAAVIVAATAMPAAAADDPIPEIGPTGPAKEIAGTFKFTEGPAADRDGVVYFTDVPVQKIYKIGPDNTASVFRDESNGANGLMFNAAGEIVSCQKNGLVVWNPKTKKERVLADKYDGKPLNRPNDLVVDATGGAYFTDPIFALDGKSNQPVSGVFYVTDDGQLTRLIDDVVGPNGIILSPDEKTLYVITFLREQMMAYPVTAPGKLGPGRIFCTVEQPEGKKGGAGATAARLTRAAIFTSPRQPACKSSTRPASC